MMASFLRHMTADQEKPGLTMVKTHHFQTQFKQIVFKLKGAMAVRRLDLYAENSNFVTIS